MRLQVGDTYTGKFTYSLAHPEEVFDISWKFNPDVILRPSERCFVFNERPDFDIWTVKMFEDVALRGGEYITMTGNEIQEAIDSLRK